MEGAQLDSGGDRWSQWRLVVYQNSQNHIPVLSDWRILTSR
jgi:hypothetical protein